MYICRMKAMKRIMMLLLLMMVAGSLTLYAQSSKEKKQQEAKAVKEKVVSKNYKTEVSVAYPLSGRMRNLTSLYSLEVKNDSVFSYLPYFGRAYSIPYGGGQGLIFNAPIDSYEMEYGKKGEARVKLVARNSEDRFQFSLSIYSNGSVSINVNMQNRESIGYSGNLVTDP